MKDNDVGENPLFGDEPGEYYLKDGRKATVQWDGFPTGGKIIIEGRKMTFQGNQIGGVPRGKRAEILKRVGIIKEESDFTEYLVWQDKEGKFWVRVTVPGSEKYEITEEDARVLVKVPE